ncbi:hypothetical protein KIN20_021993 [Parelaphostrongylus tenuis]|uniref:Uncharacterized protein n=1 Tax=Parelaphostrongylus tenuis TaxID=148309 RepID=A0AAD5MPL8_PARTN|nr:hypothetical protein KIN20_021993 [Parelaphostrongylus tenuis]
MLRTFILPWVFRTMPRIFKLDSSQRRFFTCCNKLHVKIAFFIIVVLTVIAEIIESVSYVIAGFPRFSTVFTILIEIWEYIVTLSMVLAFWRESCLLMLPFIGQMLVVVVMMLILLLQLLYCAIAPYSSLAERLFVDGRYTFVQREKKLFVMLTVIGLSTALAIWFLNIGFATYAYFDYLKQKNNKKSKRSPREQMSFFSSIPTTE